MGMLPDDQHRPDGPNDGGIKTSLHSDENGYHSDDGGYRATRIFEAESPARIETSHEAQYSLGEIDTDDDTAENAIASVIVSREGRSGFQRDTYVGVIDCEQDIEFLGRIIAGPFHPRDSSGSDPSDTDRYGVRGKIEILGRVVDGERLLSTSTRPRPASEVVVFPTDRLRRFLGTGGDFLVGHLVGNKELLVAADSNNKNFLPRNVGIFGTVGSGKSNTAQVLMEEAIRAGWAVVVIDVEGEYVRMNEPSTDERLKEILRGDYRLEPEGIRDFRVYHPTSGTSAAEHPIPFKVPISGLDPEIVIDILEFSEAEMRVYGMAARQAALYAPSEAFSNKAVRPYDLQALIDGLMETKGMSGNAVRLLPLANGNDVLTAGTVRSKLQHLASSNILDWNRTKNVPELPIGDLLMGGRLSVLDVSETDDRSRNLAIAYVLQTLFQRVIDVPRGRPMENGQPRPPVLVVIEEVHTFVSRAAAAKMKALLDNLQVISRRGRKRWMALALISQQPNHVPDEMFELANTRFIHQIKSTTNLQPVKETTGAVDDNLWTSVPAIEPGRCLLTGTTFETPLFMDVRPARSRRMLVS